MERADNVIEGHYAERLWESLFIDTALAPAIDKYVLQYSKETLGDHESVPGMALFEIGFSSPECTWECYLKENYGLEKKLGWNETNATIHYRDHGFYQGRPCACT